MNTFDKKQCKYLCDYAYLSSRWVNYSYSMSTFSMGYRMTYD